jgi:8-oxo-dGTP diphosphatase
VSDVGIDCYVIRHAHAGKRGVVDDDRRPLTAHGRAQADILARRLAGAGVIRLVSSPYVRCVETLVPSARLIGTDVEEDKRLGEGEGPARALAIVEGATAPVALCSHGDVIGELMTTLARRGLAIDDDRCAKGSTWTLTVRDGDVVACHYTPPPSVHAG